VCVCMWCGVVSSRVFYHTCSKRMPLTSVLAGVPFGKLSSTTFPGPAHCLAGPLEPPFLLNDTLGVFDLPPAGAGEEVIADEEEGPPLRDPAPKPREDGRVSALLFLVAEEDDPRGALTGRDGVLVPVLTRLFLSPLLLPPPLCTLSTPNTFDAVLFDWLVGCTLGTAEYVCTNSRVSFSTITTLPCDPPQYR
jgi:hypothetical protein